MNINFSYIHIVTSISIIEIVHVLLDFANLYIGGFQSMLLVHVVLGF